MTRKFGMTHFYMADFNMHAESTNVMIAMFA